MSERALSLYVHFPWCVAKCPYCDFNSHPLKGDLLQVDYLRALQLDFAEQSAALDSFSLSTIFFGGGTPSLFSPDAFSELMATFAPWLDADAEVTMEANPGSQEHWDFAAYRRAGINRLSLGAQSFDSAQLQRLGRIHGAEDTQRAFHLARDGGFDNINLDLMYALPNQTTNAAMFDLEQAFALNPEHISWYQLTIEAKTEFAKRPPVLPVEDSVEQMETHGHRLLADAGFERYETSAYARGGRQCAHNKNYWAFGDYLGIGAGAHGKLTHADGVVRTSKASQPRLYFDNPVLTKQLAVARTEMPAEFALNLLRLLDGVELAHISRCLGQGHLDPELVAAVVSELEETWAQQVELGLMQSERFAVTDLGANFLDNVTAAFL